MILKSLKFENFRNLAPTTIELSENISLFTGENAQGKTNVLESVFYLSTLRPIRPGHDRELIRFGAESALIEAVGTANGREHTIRIVLSANGRRRISVNGVAVKKISDYSGSVKSVLFCPEDLQIVKDAPSLRRRTVDLALVQLRERYRTALSEYNSLLKQKNTVLREKDHSLYGMLSVYGAGLANAGAVVVSLRKKYCDALSAQARIVAEELSSGRDSLSIEYRPPSGVDPDAQSTDIAAALAEGISSHLSREKEAGTTLYGPHRDDLDILINGRSARTYASQGQARTAVLSMKLAEREIFLKNTGEYPILLLDDVLSELDASRREYVLNRINSGQVIITSCTDDIVGEGRRFTLAKGEINVSSSGQ